MPGRTAETFGDSVRNDGMRDDARGKGQMPADHSRRARIFANVCLARADAECAGRGRFGRSTLQLNGETTCTFATAVGQLWEGRPAGANSRKDKSGNTR